MPDLSVQEKIINFKKSYPETKKMSMGEIIFVMTEKRIITKDEAKKCFSQLEKTNTPKISYKDVQPTGGGQTLNAVNSAFGTGFSDNLDVIPKWQKNSKPVYTKEEQTAMNLLQQMVSTADNNMKYQDSHEGFISKWIVNLTKEAFNTTNAKSNVVNAIDDTKSDIYTLENAARGEISKDFMGNKVSFKEAFRTQRGVEFSEKKIKLCEEKSKEMAKVQLVKNMTDKLKQTLTVSTINNASNAGFADANGAIKNTFMSLGITKKSDINNILKNIELKHKDDEAIKKYGGDFRFAKNKSGKYMIYRTSKDGFSAEATMEELQIIAKEMKFMINQTYAAAIDAEVPENVTPEQLEKITNDKYLEHKEGYQKTFKDAFGKKDLEALSEKYVQSQQQGVAYIEMGINFASMATMFMGSGILLKGVNYGAKAFEATSIAAKAERVVAFTANATSKAEKMSKLLMVNQIAQPVKLVENITADEADWKTYGLSAAEGALWMALGAASGAVGDKARVFLKQKGINGLVQKTGKSVDELMAMYKSGHQLPENVSKALQAIDKVATLTGSGLELSADLLLTYAGNEALHGEDLTINDVLMSINGVAIGAAMQKKSLKMRDEDKMKLIQQDLIEKNPNMSKKELETRTRAVLDLSNLIAEKAAKAVNTKQEIKVEEETSIKPEKRVKQEISSNDLPVKSKSTIANPNNERTVVKHVTLDEIEEFKSQTKKAVDNNFRDFEITKNMTEQERADFVKSLETVQESENMLWFATGNKPSVLLAKDAVAPARNLKSDKIDTVERRLVFPNGQGVDNIFVLDKKAVKEVITANKDIYQKRMKMGDNATVDEIYSKLISKDSPLKDEKNYQDIIGLTLGYPKDNTLVYALEQSKNVNPQLRYHNDLTEYKAALKNALYADDSCYKDFDDKFKKDLEDKIDSIDKVTTSMSLSSNEYLGYNYIKYFDEPEVSAEYVNRFRDVNQKLSEINNKQRVSRNESAAPVEKVNKESTVSKVNTAKIKDVIRKITEPVTAKTKDGKTVLTEYGEKILRETAADIHKIGVDNEPVVVALMEKFDLGRDKKNMTHRVKSEQSIYDKIKNAMLDEKYPMSYEKAVNSVRDGVGCRTELPVFDYKKHPDIVEMYAKDPERAFLMAAERQSEEYKESIAAVILSQSVADGELSALKISNYKGKDGLAYLSDSQVAELRDMAAERGIDLSVKEETSKVRPSGYTALQMNFKTKDGFTFEWQMRAQEVNKFAKCEHVPYDIIENKDVTGGNNKLKKLYSFVEDAVKGMSKEDFKEYNQYLTKHYDYLRKKELGFDVEKPELPEKFDNRLTADALEALHEVSSHIKKGEITENEGLDAYHKLTDEFADWSARKEPQFGDFPNKGSYINKKNELADIIISNNKKNKKSDIIEILNHAELDETALEDGIQRLSIISKKAELTPELAVKIAKTDIDMFDYISEMLNSHDEKINSKVLDYMLNLAPEQKIVYKNIKYINNPELKSKIYTLDKKLKEYALDDIGMRDIKAFPDLVFKLQGVDDEFVIKEIISNVDKLIQSSENDGVLVESVAILDVVNGAKAKYAVKDGTVHKAVKRMVDVEVKAASNEKAANVRETKLQISEKVLEGDDETSKDFNQSLKLEPLKDYASTYSKQNPEMVKYLYEKYYSSALPEKVRNLCNKIGDNYSTRLFLIKSDDLSSAKAVYRELKLWSDVSNGEAKFPPSLDLSKINEEFIGTNTAGLAYNRDKKIELKGESNIDYALRHEILHINDKLECDRFGRFGDSKQYDLRFGSTILEEKKWFREEFINGGISKYHVDYAYTNRAEFIAVASEGDFNKYSPEFKKVLIELGMPEWVLNLPKNQLSDRLAEDFKNTPYEEKYNNLLKNSSDFGYAKFDIFKAIDENPNKIDIINEIMSLKDFDGEPKYKYNSEAFVKYENEKLIKVSNFLKLKAENGYRRWSLDELCKYSDEQLDDGYILASLKNNKGSFEYTNINILNYMKMEKEARTEYLKLASLKNSDGSYSLGYYYNDYAKLPAEKLKALYPIVSMTDNNGNHPYLSSIKKLKDLKEEQLSIMQKYMSLKNGDGLYSLGYYVDDYAKLPAEKLKVLYPIVSMTDNNGNHPYLSKIDELKDLKKESLPILQKYMSLKNKDDEFKFGGYHFQNLIEIPESKLESLYDFISLKNDKGDYVLGNGYKKLFEVPENKYKSILNYLNIKNDDGEHAFKYYIDELAKMDNEHLDAFLPLAKLKDNDGNCAFAYNIDKFMDVPLDRMDALTRYAQLKTDDGNYLMSCNIADIAQTDDEHFKYIDELFSIKNKDGNLQYNGYMINKFLEIPKEKLSYITPLLKKVDSNNELVFSSYNFSDLGKIDIEKYPKLIELVNKYEKNNKEYSQYDFLYWSGNTTKELDQMIAKFD